MIKKEEKAMSLRKYIYIGLSMFKVSTLVIFLYNKQSSSKKKIRKYRSDLDLMTRSV